VVYSVRLRPTAGRQHGSDEMKKLKQDPIREARIHNDVIVDAYGPEERAMGWYYYLEDQLQFPFQARCIAANIVSPLSKGETVEVLRLAPEQSCSADMLVLIRWQGRKLAVPLSQLAAIDVDQSTADAISDWHYWLAQGYLF
jgi:Calcium binding